MAFELNNTNARKLLDYFESEKASVLDFARELCEIESPSGPSHFDVRTHQKSVKPAW